MTLKKREKRMRSRSGLLVVHKWVKRLFSHFFCHWYITTQEFHANLIYCYIQGVFFSHVIPEKNISTRTPVRSIGRSTSRELMIQRSSSSQADLKASSSPTSAPAVTS
uniref:Uncharacterized protein n=1 Tax=Oryza nivara TaxID=4536 RepID=A0A0E0FLZ1_ORYNI